MGPAVNRNSRRALGVPQLVYLVLFSHSFFWTGFTGLATTIGAILTLFVLMQSTGRVDWRQLLAARNDADASPPPGAPRS